MAKKPPSSPPSREVPATQEEVRDWLRTQPREVSIAIAERAALRALPFYDFARPANARGFANSTSALFRAIAAARAAAKYSVRVNDLDDAAAAAADASDVATAVATDATAVAANVAAYAAAYSAVTAAAAVVAANADAVAYAATATEVANANANAADIRRLARNPSALDSVLDAPLWRDGAPSDATQAWTRLRKRLSRFEDMQVWIDWYEERLRGGSHGEAYEIVFATVPVEVWEQGPPAASTWIRAHLPPPNETEGDGEPLQQRPAPFTFRLDGQRIAVAPQIARPDDRDTTEAFLDEARRKAAELQERLRNVQADPRLQTNLRLLNERLAVPAQQINVGLVVSSLASLEADAQAYDSEEGRAAHFPDLIASLADVTVTVRLLLGEYPKAREIVVRQVALGLSETPNAIEATEAATDAITQAAAEHPTLVAEATVPALREPAAGMQPSWSERGKQAALRVLTSLNFATLSGQTRQAAILTGGAGLGAWGAGEAALLIDAIGPQIEHIGTVLGGIAVGAGVAAHTIGSAAHGVRFMLSELRKLYSELQNWPPTPNKPKSKPTRSRKTPARPRARKPKPSPPP